MFLRAGQVISLLHLHARLRRALCAALCAAVCCVAAHGQVGVDDTGTGGKHIIQGRILFPSGRRSDMRLKVKLQSSASEELSVFADMNGTFAFRSLAPGSYTIIIDGGDDFETVRESVYIESDLNSSNRGIVSPSTTRPYTVQVYLQPKRNGSASPRPGVLNAALAGVPKPAADLYNKAIESRRNGDDDKAVKQLKAAVALHPGFALALKELGVLYIKMKQPDKAVETLRDALKLAPEDFATILTYGVALFNQQQFSEAEEQFRKAIQKNSSTPLAHYYLGVIMLKRHDSEGAEKELKSASEGGGREIAMAHYFLCGIYWGRREYKQAADELETYLRLAPDAPDAARTRATIKELRSQK
jgi:Tfp pilus assembly protein PilF